MNWHQKEFKAVLAELDVPIDGLRSEEAGKRLATYGRNELVEKGKRSLLAMIVDQFRDFMILILIAAAVVSGFVGDLADTIAILVIVLLNAVIGVVQEYRAEKAMEALKQMAAPVARVLRDGSVSSIPGSGIVPGNGRNAPRRTPGYGGGHLLQGLHGLLGAVLLDAATTAFRRTITRMAMVSARSPTTGHDGGSDQS